MLKRMFYSFTSAEAVNGVCRQDDLDEDAE